MAFGQGFVDAAARRRPGGEITAVLLRQLGPGHLENIVAIVDHAAGEAGGSPVALVRSVHRLLDERLSVRVPSPLTDPAGDARLAAVLWATHGAFPPGHAIWLLLRVLARASTEQTELVLGRLGRSAPGVPARVIRRALAFGLWPQIPQRLELPARVGRACQALVDASAGVTRQGGTWTASQLDELGFLLRLVLTHREVVSLPGIGSLRKRYLGSVWPLGERAGAQ
ncbi:MAG: hypothetical protein FJ206_17365 [Gemmatimonadetes bacterium]|nr:hypothetical protein [Gemmatimonadota bacterium]